MKKQSLLAKALKGLIDASGLSQEEVAKRLSMSPQIVSRWLHDETLPRPEHIKGIVRIARRFKRAAPAVQVFYMMAGLPTKKVTPFYESSKLDGSIGNYISDHCLGEFQKRIHAVTRTRTLKENEHFLKMYARFLLRVLPK